MTGEELYGAYCAALWVDWPSPKTNHYNVIFAPQPPQPPVAWPFLHAVKQAGWNNLATVLTEAEGGAS